MSNSTKVCRNLLDTRDIIKTQVTEILLAQLVGGGKISIDECKALSQNLGQCVDQQVDSLVDRIVIDLE